MEYPGARLTRPLRRVILIAFVAVFFIVAPIMLMYTTGYRYDWKMGIIRETGGLSIDVLPTTAYVYLDGLPLNSSLPIRLKNITPKKYQIKITAPGYHDWEKEVAVERRQTTYIKDIQLLKKNDPVKLYNGVIKNISLSPNGRVIAFTVSDAKNTQAMLYDLRSGKAALLTSSLNAVPVRFFWSTRHPYVAAAFGTSTYTQIVVANSENPIEISNISHRNVTRALWRDSNESALYFSTSSSLYTYYPRLREERPFTKNNYHDWFISKDNLWTLNKTSSTILSIVNDELGFRETFATVTSSDASISINNFRFNDVEADHVLLDNGAGTMLLVRRDKQYPINVQNAFLSPFGAWWLFWNNVELWSYVQGENPLLFHRSGSNLKKITPLDKFNTLALQFDQEIKVLYPYAFTQITLLKESFNDTVADAENRRLYFSTNDGLYSLVY